MKKIGRIFFFSFIFFLCTWFIGFAIFSHRIYDLRIDKDSKTDAIVVLTGGKYRLHEAMVLLNENLAEKLFISGVDKKISLQKIIDINNIENIHFEKVQIGNEATNTVENAIEVDNWIKKNNIKSIRLVTSNYHMFRSIQEISAKNKNVQIIAHPVFTDNLTKNWWQDWHSFYFLASEYNKFLYVYLKTLL
ncbi:MAG: YdcF family protein [Alphaproteobacteria bacterium]